MRISKFIFLCMAILMIMFGFISEFIFGVSMFAGMLDNLINTAAIICLVCSIIIAGLGNIMLCKIKEM